jgi:hypothetical protein
MKFCESRKISKQTFVKIKIQFNKVLIKVLSDQSGKQFSVKIYILPKSKSFCIYCIMEGFFHCDILGQNILSAKNLSGMSISEIRPSPLVSQLDSQRDLE